MIDFYIHAVVLVLYSFDWVDLELFFPEDFSLHIEERNVNRHTFHPKWWYYAFSLNICLCVVDHEAEIDLIQIFFQPFGASAAQVYLLNLFLW